MGDFIIGHVPSVDNPADICTKVLPGAQKQNHLSRLLLHEFCDGLVCLGIILSEEVCGSWGFLVAWATTYVIRWMGVYSPLKPMLHHK
jgi:hypothetical protein